MYKKRKFIDGMFYHVTSRTNDKVKIFETKIGQKIMLITLQDAKDKFRFQLTNFSIMPTHIHLLIKPVSGTSLSRIMHWIKIISAKRWNFIHGSTDHMWGQRYFAKVIISQHHYDYVYKYIDQNPVKAGYVTEPACWKASGAFHKLHDLQDLVDFTPFERFRYLKLLPPPKA
jgi:REP element-mobilizing transposase RayT